MPGAFDGNLYALNSSTGFKIWNYTTGSGITSSPAAADGAVYVGSFDKNVYAINALTGIKIWNYTMGSDVVSSPAVSDGVVYVASRDFRLFIGDEYLYALNVSTGNQIWNYKLGSSRYRGETGSPAVSQSVVYIGSDDGYLYAVNASTGQKIGNSMKQPVLSLLLLSLEALFTLVQE
jgi:outer membrane protein assembly factor BamB